MFKRAIFPLMVAALVPAETSAHAPTDCDAPRDMPPSDCPASGACIEITDDYQLKPTCDYQDFKFYITESGSESDPLVFDCRGSTLRGSHSVKTAINMHSHENGTQQVRHVVVQNCNIDGYENGIKTYLVETPDTKEEIKSTYRALFYDPLAQDAAMAAIHTRLRELATQHIRFDNVHVRNAANSGLYLYPYSHHIVFRNGSARNNGKTGVYLDASSRRNTIRDSDISNNGREGIAIDSSALNYVLNNRMVSNRGGAVRLYRNFWEKEAEGHRPRAQHAFGNIISGNEMRGPDSRYPVPVIHIGYRQSKKSKAGAWSDPVFLYHDDHRHYRENAELNLITDNTIAAYTFGIKVYDDNNSIVGNRFSMLNDRNWGGARIAMVVGNGIRERAGDLVYGTRIDGNRFDPGEVLYAPVSIADCTAGTTGSGNIWSGEPYSLPGTECTSRRATAWAHHGGPSGFAYKSTFSQLTSKFNHPDQRALIGNFDGEEGDDLVLIHGSSDGQARITIHLSTSSGFAHRTHYQWFPEYEQTDRWLAGDVNDDGKDDLVRVFNGPDNRATARVHFSQGIEFAYHDAPVRVFANYFGSDQQWLMGDFNEDEKDDLVVIRERPDGRAEARVMGSNGDGFDRLTSVTLLANYWPEQKWRAGDFDGDGKDDLVNIYGASGTAIAWVHRSTGTGFEFRTSLDRLAGFWDEQKWVVTDFDNNEKDDLVNVYENDGKAQVWRHASAGSGFEFRTGLQTLAGFFKNQRWVTGDFDADGYGDLLDVYGATGSDAW